MIYPNLNEEKTLWEQGYELVVGLDEAGRGPLAGPVVAAAVLVSPNFKIQHSLPKIQDSKKLSEKKREEFYNTLTLHPSISWGVGIISEKVIDKINILEATKLAMQKAAGNLLQKFDDRPFFTGGCFLILDGNFKIKSNLPQKSIVRGDETVFSCVAAGIIAKVTRDRIMQKMHQKYPRYGFNLHKGYGTRLHLANLRQLGPCKIHRKSFYPVSLLSKSNISDRMETINLKS